MTRAPRLEQPLTLYRGVRSDYATGPGGYTTTKCESLTADVQVLSKFETAAVYKYRIPAGTPLLGLHYVTSWEKEFLLPIGSSFRVVGRSTQGTLTVVDLEYIEGSGEEYQPRPVTPYPLREMAEVVSARSRPVAGLRLYRFYLVFGKDGRGNLYNPRVVFVLTSMSITRYYTVKVSPPGCRQDVVDLSSENEIVFPVDVLDETFRGSFTVSSYKKDLDLEYVRNLTRDERFSRDISDVLGVSKERSTQMYDEFVQQIQLWLSKPS